jgi:branched-chain amino acid transport system permease protein
MLHDRWQSIGPVAALALVALLAAMPWLGVDLNWQRNVILIAILALVVGGLNLSFGYAGELALGQVFMYATGAYTAGYLSLHGVSNLVVVVVAASAAALVVGIVTGAAGLRLGGWMLALVSLLLLLLIPRIINLLHELGGFAGLAGITRPTLGGIDFTEPSTFYVLVVLSAAAWFAAMRNLVHSRYGVRFLTMKESPVLARSLGVSTFRTKLLAYALGSVPAGIAGALYAFHDGYIAPSAFTFELGMLVLVAGIVGGTQSVYGALLGAAVLQLGSMELTVFGEYTEVAYGVLLILCGVLFSIGIAGLGRRLLQRVLAMGVDTTEAMNDVHDPTVPDLSGETLHVSDVTVRFGGFTALDGVSLDARPGAVTALIGPNGSGKTTLLNVISGLLAPNEGTVIVGAHGEVRTASAASRLSMARTFQTPLIPETMSVRDVALSGRLSRRGPSLLTTVLRLPGYRRRRTEELAAAAEALGAVGLAHAGHLQASTLPLGARRLLEFARALASGPSVLLLDEVASGLDQHELEELAELIRAVRDAGATVVLVEHNFDLVRTISDHVVVLAEGALLASGTPDEVATDERVVNLYLGSTARARSSEKEPIR